MAKYKAYPEYKYSGVEWLGLMPKSWTICRLKNLATIKNGQDYKSVQADDGYPVMGSGGQFTFASKFMYDKPSVLLGRKGTIDKPLYINEPFWTVDTMYYTELNEAFDAKYLHYLALTIQFSRYSTNTALPSMTQEHLSNYKFSVPKAESERKKITEFLDLETAKIDNLIDKQQQLIELLKEKRQAVISHAVTKGLNPDVPMKDSGVEWLGDVPEHWEVKRIKHFGKVIGGFAFKSTDFTDEGYPVIKISNVSHLSFDWGDSSFLPPSFSFTHKEYLAPNGALVFAMTRPVISGGIKVTLLDDDSAPLVNQRVGFMMVRSKNMARYILISTQSSAFLAHFVNNMTVTNQPNISSEGIESIYLPVPPMNEISRILLYVDRMNESYNQLIDRALLQVSLLQERRTALISAAVTGKIDVRDWVAPDTQDVEEPQEATA